MKIGVLIGESFNENRTSEGLPRNIWSGAFTTPPGASTKVLLDWLGLTYEEFNAYFDTYNVFNRDKEPMPSDMKERLWKEHKAVVLVGQTAIKLFFGDSGLSVPFFQTGCKITTLPHPSGLNRQLNDPIMIKKCKQVGKKIKRRLKASDK